MSNKQWSLIVVVIMIAVGSIGIRFLMNAQTKDEDWRQRVGRVDELVSKQYGTIEDLQIRIDGLTSDLFETANSAQSCADLHKVEVLAFDTQLSDQALVIRKIRQVNAIWRRSLNQCAENIDYARGGAWEIIWGESVDFQALISRSSTAPTIVDAPSVNTGVGLLASDSILGGESEPINLIFEPWPRTSFQSYGAKFIYTTSLRGKAGGTNNLGVESMNYGP